jgi:hypothetical protein
MRWLLYAAGGLVFLAGIQLFLLTEQTATFFAWTVVPPLTAAFLGAAYWAAVPVEVFSARQRTWASARASIPGIWLFTTLTLVATALHVGRFHFAAADVVPRAAAWLWLAIYTVVPIGMLVVGFTQLRAPGGDPDRVRTLPSLLRLGLVVLGGGMMAVGSVLFIAPAAIDPSWPWALSPLTSQAIGAWLLGSGLAAFFAIRENDVVRIRPVGAGYAVFSILELVALARYPATVDWSTPAAWVYLTFLLALLPVGLYVSFAGQIGSGGALESTAPT